MEENYGVARTEVMMDGPFDGERGLVGEVDGDADATLGGGSGSVGGVRSGGTVAWGRSFDFNGSQEGKVGVRGGGGLLGMHLGSNLGKIGVWGGGGGVVVVVDV